MKYTSTFETLAARLTRHGVSFEYDSRVPCTEVDSKHSLAINPRLNGALNAEHVECILLSSRAGELFPPLFLQLTNRRKQPYTIRCGNHRFAAAVKDGDRFVSAIVTRCDDEFVLSLIAEADNTNNGMSLTHEERLVQAVALSRRYPNVPIKQIAQEFRLGDDVLTKTIRAERIRDDLMAEGMAFAEKLPKTRLLRIGTFENDRPVMLRVAQVGMQLASGEEFEEMVTSARSGKSESERIEIVERFSPVVKRYEPKAKQSSETKARNAYVRTMRSMSSFVAQYPTLEHCFVTSATEKAVKVREWESLREKLDAMHGLNK